VSENVLEPTDLPETPLAVIQPITSIPRKSVIDITPIGEIHLGFAEVIGRLLEGKKVTKIEWGDKRSYGLMKDTLLQLHKKGEAEEVTHPWILNDGDLTGWDWVVLDE
jgi:hypothetical protein